MRFRDLQTGDFSAHTTLDEQKVYCVTTWG